MYTEKKRAVYESVKERIKSNKNVLDYDEAGLKYLLTKPMGKAVYKQTQDDFRLVDDTDLEPYRHKVQCRDCGRVVSRSNVSHHKQSKVHQTHVKLNENFIKFMQDAHSTMNRKEYLKVVEKLS